MKNISRKDTMKTCACTGKRHDAMPAIWSFSPRSYRMFCLMLKESWLALSDEHFVINEPSLTTVVQVFTQQYDFTAKQDTVSNEFGTLKVDKYRKKDTSKEEVLTKLVDRMTRLYSFSLLPGRIKAMQKSFLKRTVSESDWALYANNHTVGPQPYPSYVGFLLSAAHTVESQNKKYHKKSKKHTLRRSKSIRYEILLQTTNKFSCLSTFAILAAVARPHANFYSHCCSC